MPTFDGSPSSGATHIYALWDAAYVLGSLSCSERREFEAHLPTCVACTEAVAELSGVPALLSHIDRTYVDTIDEHSIPVSPTLLPLRDQVLATVNSRRRRSRAMTWALATAAAVAIGIFVVIQANPMALTPTQRNDALALAMTPVKPLPFAASVTLSRRAWGTRIDMNCTYTDRSAGIEYADRLAMVAVGRDGSSMQLVTWTARAGVPESLGASTSMPIEHIASVRIVSVNAGTVLLNRDL